MVVDTSALVAILKVEPDAAELLLCLSQASSAVISTATLLEAQMVVCSHLGEAGLPELELLLSRTDVRPVAFERSHLHWALEGWGHYGNGRHRAGLNLGDCFSYGLAKALDLPLLFKGDDFELTDVQAAL
jgi:ribonuclease VapC